MNRLQHETSPYLLQHAANPVDWYPWGQEALDKAEAENKPILVSIGYSTCHWCHVMERESFENPDVAAIMNTHFVCIKVDREERPDVDQLYMEACQAISGGGGWPLNAFLLPDARPFYAGTYFPPRSAHNRPGWIDLLDRISSVWRANQPALEQQAEQITKGILENNSLFISPDGETADLFGRTAIDGMIGRLKQRYDLQRGGFGGAPKFPMSQSLELLLDYGLLYEDEPALQMAEHAVRSMIGGGIYDQLRGGFSRYTVDAGWRVPHFEKMLYDNALLLRLLGKLQMSRPNPLYQTAITETINWLRAEMLSTEGTFFAALDADSEGVEGKFYIWDHAELKDSCTTEELALLTNYFGLTESGNWAEENTNILYRSAPVPADKVEDWQRLQQKMLTVRAGRIRPGRDEKIILQWNALMISGLSYAYRATGDQRVRKLALTAYAALKELLYREGTWYRNAKDGRLGKTAFLDDLTALNTARLDLFDITQDLSYIGETEKNLSEILENFGGAPGGLYHLVPPADTELPVQSLDLYDNALPSGNGQLLHLLRRLSAYTGKTGYRALAEEKVSALGANVLKYPSSFANLGRLLLLLSYPTRELVVSGTGAMASVEAMLKKYRPDLAIVVAATKETEYPLLEGRYSEKKPQFYLCQNQSCRLPVSSLAELSL